MSAAQERNSGYAASLEAPCASCRNEARALGTVLCLQCLSAAAHLALDATLQEHEQAA